MNKSLLILIAFINSINAFPQNIEDNTSKSSFIYNVDFVSRYVWRGLMLDENPNIQPYATFTAGNFSIGSWASYGVSDIYSEVDFYTSLTLKGLTLTLSDYYCMNGSQNYKFFDFGQKTTNHALEGSANYKISENFPVNITAGVFFYGNDRDSTGTNFYSTYFELAYPFSCKGYDFNAFIGGTPSNGYYATSANIVNIGISFTKRVNITDKILLPFSASIINNPNSESIYFIMKITF